jgi:hypothetical protein
MKSLGSEAKIISIANALRLKGGDAAETVIDYCRRQVASIWQRSSALHSIADLERAVCTQLNLVIHEVWSNEDVQRLSQHYSVGEREYVFAALANQLDAKTFGILIQRTRRLDDTAYRYVAVIDCRGAKAWRRFFTVWHEIAHCLTTVEQFELPFRRTTANTEKDPVEKLMDIIAGELGFFDPIFIPVLRAKVEKHGKLTFAAVEEIRQEFCPAASFQATLNACVDRISVPAISVVAGLGHKAHESRVISDRQAQFFPTAQPRRQFRVQSAIQNRAARGTALRIHKNMRIPLSSIVAKVFRDEGGGDTATARESLGTWGCSDGSRLASLDVEIQAKKIADQVFALVTLVNTD